MKKILILVLLLNFIFPLSVYAKRINPETDLEYKGAFRVPIVSTSYTAWIYNQKGLAFNPEGNNGQGSLFFNNRNHTISEISVPTPKISPTKNLAELNQAVVLQPMTDVTEGKFAALNATRGNVLDMSGLVVLPPFGNQTASKLYWTIREYYMPNKDTPVLGWSDLNFTNLNSAGVWRAGDNSCQISASLFEIPKSWADQYAQGKYLGGHRFRSQVCNTYGPTIVALDPWNFGNPPADGTVLAKKNILMYDAQHKPPYNHSMSDDWFGVAWVDGNKEAVIFPGTKGYADDTEGGGNNLEYYDHSSGTAQTDILPDACSTSHGYHSDPKLPIFLFYDPNELATAPNVYSTAPYATWYPSEVLFRPVTYKLGPYKNRMPCSVSGGALLGGVAYDRINKNIYIVEHGADFLLNGYNPPPIIHVWHVRDGIDKAFDAVAPTVSTNLTFDLATKKLSWTASSDENAITYIIWRFVNHLVGGVVQSRFEPVAYSTTNSWTDYNYDKYTAPSHKYKIIAMDSFGNQSDFSAELDADNFGNLPPPVKYHLSDFLTLVTNWLKTISSSADLNGDGIINSKDLGKIMSNWE